MRECLREGVIKPTALYGAEAWGISSADRRKINVLEMKCFRRLMGVSQLDTVMNEEERSRVGNEMELVSRVEQRVLRWFGHVARIDEYRMTERVLMAGTGDRG